MDRTAIEAIRENQAFNIDKLQSIDNFAIVIPDNAKLESLEYLNNTPNLFIAKFNTHISSEFVDYCGENKKDTSAIYIDTDEMIADAIFDHGNNDDPQWADHRAKLQLKKSPAYQELLSTNNSNLDQQPLIDFLSDWQERVVVYDADNKEIPFRTAINRIRKLTLNQNRTTDVEQGEFKAQASAMESVEIKSGEDKLPAYFEFTTRPYAPLDPQKFHCSLRANTDGKAVSIKYRINGLLVQQEAIAIEFREQLENEIDSDMTIYIGSMALR